jgi:hypothetical protein
MPTRRIARSEADLLCSLRELQYGDFMPVRMLNLAPCEVEVHPAEVALISAIHLYGLPIMIRVADGLPQFAEWEISSEAGTGIRRINLTGKPRGSR